MKNLTLEQIKNLNKTQKVLTEDSIIEVTDKGEFYLHHKDKKIWIETEKNIIFDSYVSCSHIVEHYTGKNGENTDENGMITSVTWRNGDFETPFTFENIHLGALAYISTYLTRLS